VDEIGQRIGGEHHDGHGDDDRDHHDGHVIGHADGGNDAVHRKHDVQHHDLADGRRHSHRAAWLEQVGTGVRVDVVVDFLGGLPDQEQAAGQQDDVAPGEAVAQHLEHRLGEPYDDSHRAQQGQPHDQRQPDADAARLAAVFRGQPVGQDRDEDEVVDAQHHFHRHKRDQGDPGGGVGG
jgi:hypothetical protein